MWLSLREQGRTADAGAETVAAAPVVKLPGELAPAPLVALFLTVVLIAAPSRRRRPRRRARPHRRPRRQHLVRCPAGPAVRHGRPLLALAPPDPQRALLPHLAARRRAGRLRLATPSLLAAQVRSGRTPA